MALIRRTTTEIIETREILSDEQETEINQMLNDDLTIESVINFLKKEKISILNEDNYTQVSITILNMDLTSQELKILKDISEILGDVI